MNRKITRCAVYTRKSSEEGLEQDFNSLDAQREAGEAYIKSQKHEGWELITTKYDDGGYSGGNMERPALKQLLTDIEAGKIDVIVVYKVDRLSRALSDFAKMVEVFDKHNVSFVSVTQQFNTTTSMGRLTLNVLLSFAQFEREVTGERIRDKFAASKKKGIWMGGRPPLGYDVKDRKLIINEQEEKIVRYIFTRYAERNDNQTLSRFLDELKAKGYRTKSWHTQNGKFVKGCQFALSDLYRVLNNHLYLGKVKFKENIYDGEHEAIISQELWDQAQSKAKQVSLTKHRNNTIERPKLYGKIWDYHGNKLSPTYSYKYSSTGRYKMRYYINQEIKKNGKTNSEFKRIRADHVDTTVENEIKLLLNNITNTVLTSKDPEILSAFLKELQEFRQAPVNFLSKVILYPDHLELHLILKYSGNALSKDSLKDLLKIENLDINLGSENQLNFKTNIPVHYKKFANKFCIITKGTELSEAEIDKEYYHPDDRTFTFIAKGFYWSKEIRDGVYKDSSQIAKSQNHDKSYVKRSLRQRYLSPKIIEKIVSKENNKQIDVNYLIALNNWCWQNQILKITSL